MNLQQLQYILAVDSLRHFGKAAQECFVSQPTLSAMIQKLEEELDVQIFDRSKHPTVTTECGKEIIDQARVILNEIEMLKQIAQITKGTVKGKLKLGIIPTIAPYLLPLFLKELMDTYPEFMLEIKEESTNNIVNDLKNGTIDVGIMATPLDDPELHEDPVYYEPLKVFVSSFLKDALKEYLAPADINLQDVWLLEEGNCLRDQFINLCNLKENKLLNKKIKFQTGNMNTLLDLVELNKGITLIPGLATFKLNQQQQNQVKEFKAPVPVREISFVTYRSAAKKRLYEILKNVVAHKVKPKSDQMIRDQKIRIINIY
ncbi:MAG: LysR substrate-binding domain-containing protein [Candidatus Cyclobacteriaceae bacterium M3_2C_046]